MDPGRQICAVLFLAVPPPDHGEFAYLYDELYIVNCDAELFGERMAAKCTGQKFEVFLIDHQQSRITEMGSGKNIEELYAYALRKRSIKSELTGSGFAWGDSNVVAGVECMRLWLRLREDGTCRLRVMKEAVPSFVKEVRHYRYKRVAGIIQEKPDDRGKVHLMAAWRYLAQHDPRWVAPKVGRGTMNPVLAALKRKQNKKNEDRPLVMLGPGGA